MAILRARKAVEVLGSKKIVVICMDKSREGYGLLDFYKENMPAGTKITYMSRKEAREEFKLQESENTLEFINGILDSESSDTHFVFDECPIYSNFYIESKRVFSYDWSKLSFKFRGKTHSATVCIQPILYNKKDTSLMGNKIKVVPPKAGHHIQLSRQFRSSRSIYKAIEMIQSHGNTQVLELEGEVGHDILGPKVKWISLDNEAEREYMLEVTGKCIGEDLKHHNLKASNTRVLYNNAIELEFAMQVLHQMPSFNECLDTLGSFLGCESLAVLAFCSESTTDRVLEMLSRARLVGYFITTPTAAVTEVIENMPGETVEKFDVILELIKKNVKEACRTLKKEDIEAHKIEVKKSTICSVGKHDERRLVHLMFDDSEKPLDTKTDYDVWPALPSAPWRGKVGSG